MARPIDLTTDPATPPLYWRAAAVATLYGVSVETYLADCKAGRIPVRVAHFGVRADSYVVKADVLAHLESLLPKTTTTEGATP